jgi:hypothetical protein
MSSVPPTAPTPGGTPQVPPPTPQKSSGNKVLFWILGIVLGLVALSLGTCAVIGMYAVHKVKQAGMDSDLMQKNPAYATAKLAVSMSPDAEIVSSDDAAGTIVVRDKKTGKVMTMKFDPEKKTMVMTDEKGETATLSTSGEGKDAGVEMKSSEGTMKIGGNADKAPEWVPAYPGSSPQSTFSSSHEGEQAGSFAFTTSDPPEKVISFYENSLKSGGFAVSNMTSNAEGKMGGMVSGEDKANKRTVVVTLGAEENGTQVNVTFSVKQ